MSNKEISNIIKKDSTTSAVKNLIKTAKNNGSRDNISTLIIKIKDLK
jgi:serine/threonine protein phosphatase PrpC